MISQTAKTWAWLTSIAVIGAYFIKLTTTYNINWNFIPLRAFVMLTAEAFGALAFSAFIAFIINAITKRGFLNIFTWANIIVAIALIIGH